MLDPVHHIFIDSVVVSYILGGKETRFNFIISISWFWLGLFAKYFGVRFVFNLILLVACMFYTLDSVVHQVWSL